MHVAQGFEPVAALFERQLRDELGAALCVYRGDECVVDLHGGFADVARTRPWQRDTRIVVFSVTKGLVAMAFDRVRDRFDWNAPVAEYWPAFGKPAITVRMVLEHRAGLVGVSAPITLEQCIAHDAALVEVLEREEPRWEPGTQQAYHGITYGLYARELYRRITGDPIGFTSEGVSLGTPEEYDASIAELAPASFGGNTLRMITSPPRSPEARIARDVILGGKRSTVRAAFGRPRARADRYNSIAVRRAPLAWASATATAVGLAKAYVPYLERRDLAERGSWSERDRVLHKPVGWTRGFLKEGPHVFSPNIASFGHAGMGGSLGWCDPTAGLTIGYVVNRLDWRVRSPRTLALCRALYACVR